MGGYEKNGIWLDGYLNANFALITEFYFSLPLDILPYFFHNMYSIQHIC